MATTPLKREVKPTNNDADKLREGIINNIPENKEKSIKEELANSKKSKEWQNWCLRIKKSTLNEIDEIIQGREWVGYKKTTWILQAIYKELENEKAKANGKQE